MSSLLALGYWLWSAFVAGAAGFVGATLNCDDDESCNLGSPSWIEPWNWGEYYVIPEVRYFALVGLAAATTFVVAAHFGRRVLAAVMLALSLALLSYPFFAGLTGQGRLLLGFGPLLGIAALATTWRGSNEIF